MESVEVEGRSVDTAFPSNLQDVGICWVCGRTIEGGQMLGGPGWGNAITCFWVVIMFFIFVFAFFYYEKKKNKNKANDKQTTNQEVEND